MLLLSLFCPFSVLKFESELLCLCPRAGSPNDIDSCCPLVCELCGCAHDGLSLGLCGDTSKDITSDGDFKMPLSPSNSCTSTSIMHLPQVEHVQCVLVPNGTNCIAAMWKRRERGRRTSEDGKVVAVVVFVYGCYI